MRLFKKEEMAISFCYNFNKKGKLSGYRPISKVDILHDLGQSYFFKKEDMELFKLFRAKIKRYLKNGYQRCGLAMRKFQEGGEKSSYLHAKMEKVVDYTTGLESLYIMENQELAYRLSLRMATLLGKTAQEIEKIYKDTKAMYGIRSAIVHGGSIKEPQEIFLAKHVCKYGDYLRKSILAFFDLFSKYKNKEEILRSLDHALLDFNLRKNIQKYLKILKIVA